MPIIRSILIGSKISASIRSSSCHCIFPHSHWHERSNGQTPIFLCVGAQIFKSRSVNWALLLNPASYRMPRSLRMTWDTEPVMVKQSHYRPGQSLRVPGGWGSQIWRQSAHEGGKFVRLTHRPPLPPRKYSWYSFLLDWVNPRTIVRPEGLCQWKIPVTAPAIEPDTFRLVAQCLNQPETWAVGITAGSIEVPGRKGLWLETIIIIIIIIIKYQKLANEICATWNQKAAQLIPIVISSTAVIPKSLSQSLTTLNLHPNTYIQLQKSVILGTCSIVRNFLNYK